MATTTNYGWTTPDDTALVKDGAAAIRTLGSSIDTSLNTALGTKKAGMVLLNTTSFSGAVSAVSVSSIFSATYENYKLVLNNGTAVSGDNVAFSFRLRTGGTSSSTGYYGVGTNAGQGTLVNYSQNNTSSFFLAAYDDTSPTINAVVVDLFQPFTAAVTKIFSESIGTDSTATQTRGFKFQGYHNVATSYDSIEFLINSGTFTGGTLRVYGYNN